MTQERSQIINLTLQLKELEIEQTKGKARRWENNKYQSQDK